MMRKPAFYAVSAIVCFLLVHSAAGAETAPAKTLAAAAAAETSGDLERAFTLYRQAAELEPGNQQAAIGYKRTRFQAGQLHVNRGLELRRKGDLSGAQAEFEKAAAIDPSSIVATDEAGRATREIEKPKGETPPLARAPRLAPKAAMLPEVKICNQPPAVIFQTIGKVAGIDVLFERGSMPAKTFTVHLRDRKVQDALDEVAMVTKCFWKPLSAESIFVTADNPQTRRDYEDQEMAAFYLRNITTQQELAEVVNVVRTMLDLRRVFLYNTQSAIFIRGTADQIRAATKLIGDMDKPKSEVVVDVVVMETSRSRSRQISTALTGGAALGIPVTFTPRTTTSSSTSSDSSSSSTTTTTTTPLSALGRLSSADFSLTLPGMNLALDASDSQTRILQSPQVRASDGQKAVLKIGQKVPFATGSFSSALATTTNALVNTQLSYADIGVNVELIPRVHGRDELTLHIDIDISNVADYVDIGGVSQPVIGQRKVSHEVRLREGQATVLAGLAENQDSKLNSGIPGLVNIPVLRRLFSNDKSDRSLHDLLIVLIPHIVRTPEYTPANVEPIQIGSETVIRVKSGQ